VTYTPGGAGRQLQLVSGGGTYISANAHYAPNGDLCYRQDDWDGSWTTTKTFNNRLQPATIQSVQQFSGTPPPVCGISQIYSGGCCSSVLDLSYSFTDASGHNNGNVQRISNNLNSQRTELFSYDTLNRLSTAETSSTYATSPANCWGEQYTYDAWGNLSGISGASSAYNGCTQESLSMSPTTKNQLQDTNSDFVYDSAGNLTQPGPSGGTYVFDAENHLTSAGGVTYTYDGDGNRVMKSNGTIYWYGANSASLVETDLTGDILRWYYFFNGQRVARQLYTNEVGFYMTDHLGNVRYLGGSANGYSIDYYPFGGIIVNSDIGDDRYQFTGKERDSESGLDNFGARYDSSSLGRFMSPDPLSRAGLPLDTHDPQSWNAYAYVRNNPLNLTDPDGTNYLVCEQDGKNCADLTDKQYEQFRQDNPNLRVTPSGDIYTINQNGTETKTGSETYYNEKDKQAAGQIGQFAGPIEFLGLAEFAILGPYAGPALVGTAPEIGLTGLGFGAGGLAIGKMGDLNAPGGVNPGEYTLPGKGMPNQGSPQANWEQNASMLRFEMSKGEPIRDASAGNPNSETGFLRAERNLLRDHGWTQQGDYWVPPKK
jgi:RHS repeat-associated protein